MHEITVVRTTDTGHRVVGHEGKCKFLHGHTYEFEITLRSDELVGPGFVMDFGGVKDHIDLWDHRLLIWTEDPFLWEAEGVRDPHPWGIYLVPFNPTAENMAQHLAETFYEEENIDYVSAIVRETESTAAEYVMP